MHDALEEVCDRLLRSGTLPDTGGTPATVIITISEHDLAARKRWGVSSDGTTLSADTIADLAGEADVYPTVIGSTGVVLQVGRTRRLATPGQTVALIARDGGCSFPGCDRPPEWCERHHIVEWAQAGRTDLDNLTLLCSYHHHNFATRLDLPDDRRPARLDPTPLGRPRATPPAECEDHRPTTGAADMRCELLKVTRRRAPLWARAMGRTGGGERRATRSAAESSAGRPAVPRESGAGRRGRAATPGAGALAVSRPRLPQPRTSSRGG